MGVYIKGNPSEGIYRLTYQNTSDKGMVAVLEGDDIAFIGQIVKVPHGRLIDEDTIPDRTLRVLLETAKASTVIEAEESK